MASANDKDKTVQDRKNKAKTMREERKLSESGKAAYRHFTIT